MGLPNMAPAISDNCFIAPSANIVGNVKVLPLPFCFVLAGGGSCGSFPCTATQQYVSKAS